MAKSPVGAPEMLAKILKEMGNVFDRALSAIKSPPASQAA
jgi:hypothetical protein